LIDEAGSMIRTEIDSLPTELDEVRRRVFQLEIEKEALSKEKDKASQERLIFLEKELSELKEKDKEMTAKYEKEKADITGVRDLKEKLDKARGELEKAERNYELNKVAIKYGVILTLRSRLKRMRII
jgi:ATP-dependent Clp protease ATP-binding subunit ClpB